MATDLLIDMDTYLTTLGVSTVGMLFRDTLPELPDFAIALYEYSGNSPLPQISGATRYVQVVARSPVPSEAKSKAREIYHAFVSEDGILNLTAARWALIMLQQPPFKLKMDEKDRVYYCFNMVITTYDD